MSISSPHLRPLSRRRLLFGAAGAISSAILAACGQEASTPTTGSLVIPTAAPTRIVSIPTPLPTATPVIPISLGPVDLVETIMAGLRGPVGVTTDGQGNRYIIDRTARMFKFALNGQSLGMWGSQGNGDGQFLLVDAMILGANIATDAQSNIYVPDPGKARIQKFDANGGFVVAWGSRGMTDGDFLFPHGVAVDPRRNIVYVADTNNRRIQVFNTAGDFHAAWRTGATTPVAVAVDGQGNLAAIDADGNRIHRLDPNGQWLTEWGSYGPGEAQFSRPLSGAFDAAGNLYIADTGNHRVQEFDGAGRFIAQWGMQGARNGEFQSPSNIAVDVTGNILVADTGNDRICVFRRR